MEHPATAAAAAEASLSPKRKSIAVGNPEDYEEMCHLGAGSYGAVVKARHRATDKTVAIKRITAPDVVDREEELRREARFLEACSGIPFVIAFHGLVRDPANNSADLGLVMEFVGPSVADLLLRQRGHNIPIPDASVRAVTRQLLTAADKMQERGIVHRDIKPENILVDQDQGIVKLCDFGLAMSLISDAPPYEPAGTMCYKAPEMLLDMPEYDARVDAWSIGCVMATILRGGRPLFQGCYEEGQLCAIFDVLGVPDDETWPGFSSTDFATEVAPELDMQRYNVLREFFPEATLSEEGFQVLSGLLTCNPDKRLTAAAALEMPWFTNYVDVLELPRKEVPSALPKPKKKRLLVASEEFAKRQKLQCV